MQQSFQAKGQYSKDLFTLTREIFLPLRGKEACVPSITPSAFETVDPRS